MPDKLIRIATYWSSFEAETAKLHLDSNGIQSIVSSGAMNAMMGELGGTLSPIELLVREIDEESAKWALSTLESVQETEDWVCSKCNESIPGSFAVCWSCGDDRATCAAPTRPMADCEQLVFDNNAINPATFVENGFQTIDVDPHDNSLPYAPPRTLAKDQRIRSQPSIVKSSLDTSEAGAIIDRAWKASIIGILLLPPLLHIYSLYLLFQSCWTTQPVSTSHQRKFVASLVLNFVLISLLPLTYLLMLTAYN